MNRSLEYKRSSSNFTITLSEPVAEIGQVQRLGISTTSLQFVVSYFPICVLSLRLMGTWILNKTFDRAFAVIYGVKDMESLLWETIPLWLIELKYLKRPHLRIGTKGLAVIKSVQPIDLLE